MGWLEFIASVVSSMAWPIAAVIIALAFRKQLTSLLNKIRRLSWGDKALDFSEKLDKVERVIDAELENTGTLELTPPIPDSRFQRLLEISPSAAILDSWTTVDRLLREIGKQHGYDRKSVLATNQVARQLHNDGLISASVYEMVRDLRGIRNSAAYHRDVNPTDAYRFNELADKVTTALQRLRT